MNLENNECVVDICGYKNQNPILPIRKDILDQTPKSKPPNS